MTATLFFFPQPNRLSLDSVFSGHLSRRLVFDSQIRGGLAAAAAAAAAAAPRLPPPDEGLVPLVGALPPPFDQVLPVAVEEEERRVQDLWGKKCYEKHCLTKTAIIERWQEGRQRGPKFCCKGKGGGDIF